MLQFADYRLDLSGRSLTTQSGREIALTQREHRLLREFLRRPGRLLSRDHLLQVVSGREAEVYDRSIDMLIVRLRRKIEMNPN